MAFRYIYFGVIVSIDFGTSFSGTCYAFTGTMTPKELRTTNYPDIFHINDWPQQNFSEYKTPSINIYDRNFHLIHWGKSALDFIKSGKSQRDMHIIEKFKLNLPSTIAQKNAIQKVGNTSQRELLNMRATVDYFREIFDHTVSTMQNHSISTKDSSNLIEKENIRFVITVPAHWNDLQRDIMRNVAKEAGLISEEDHVNRLLIINESLAAILHCEQKIISKNINQDIKARLLSKNDRYMICDAGGITVNISVFESTDYGNGHCQLTENSWRKCGSVYLDLRMKNFLLLICFGKTEEYLHTHKEERIALEVLISPLMDSFLKIKTTFGKRSSSFKPQSCSHVNEHENKEENNDYESSDDDCLSDYYDENEYESDNNSNKATQNICKKCDIDIEDDYKYVQHDDFGDETKFRVTQTILLDQLQENTEIEGVIVEKNYSECYITISYKCMREKVFDDVINNTLDLLKRQIQKANNKISRMYLVGGFGGSPYLRKRINMVFGPGKELRINELIYDDIGDIAVMRGALIYGISGSRKEPQSDVVENGYKSIETNQFNTLVCIDIGYNGTACSYRDLRNEGEDMIEIVNWPGLKEPNYMIPTAKKEEEGKTLWGAQVLQTTNLEQETLIVPSELMSILKSDFRTYLCDYLKLVFEHVYSVISKNHPEISDKNKYRYVITMENCYRFFNYKREMRKIAQKAGIISENDSPKRLLLISRDNAAAMHFEKSIFSERKEYSSHFLQISVYHDICHLSLSKSTKISGFDKLADISSRKATKIIIDCFRNVRSMRSSTFTFNFVAKIVANLDSLLSKSSKYTSCKDPKYHDTHGSTYYSELREGFLEYIKNKLDFNRSDMNRTIIIIISKCCEVSITVYDLLEHVFYPATHDLVSEINRSATQVDMLRLFNLDDIFLSGFLIETKRDAYCFIEKYLLNHMSKVMNIPSNRIIPSFINGKEALLGAAHYGIYPEDFTERVSRKSYMVNVCAYKRKEFDDITKNNISSIEKKNDESMKNDIYIEEAINAFIDESKPVNLYQYSNLKTEDVIKAPKDITFLIQRGEKISEQKQVNGISKTFYAKEECIVYATIYCSEATLPEDEAMIELKKLEKLHRFEIYSKHVEFNAMTLDRIYFDIRLILDNENETEFEATLCSGLGSKIPKFRFRDEILVANIYGDEEKINYGDLTIK